MRGRSLAMAALLAAALVAGCGKSDDGERKESASSASKAAAPAVDPTLSDPEPPPAAAPSGPVTPTGEEQVTADRAAAVLEELGKIAESSKGNCDKAATAMKAVIDKNKPVLAAAEKLGQDEGKEQWLAEKYGPRTDAAKSKLMPLLEKCADHEGIATVFDSIE